MGAGRLTQSSKDSIVRASKERRLYITKGGTTEQHCDRCGKAEPGIIVSVCSSLQDVLNDPMSGEIFLFGSKCFALVQKELGLSDYINPEEAS